MLDITTLMEDAVTLKLEDEMRLQTPVMFNPLEIKENELLKDGEKIAILE